LESRSGRGVQHYAKWKHETTCLKHENQNRLLSPIPEVGEPYFSEYDDI